MMRDHSHGLAIPALCDVEVMSAMRKAIRTRRLTPERALQATEDYLALPLRRFPHEAALRRILELRDNFGTYDAAYVALAEALGVPLVTADSHLTDAVEIHLAR